MTPVEILTLAPLGALVVIFGLQPGLLLDLVPARSPTTLDVGRAGGADRDPDRRSSVAAADPAVVGVVARIAWVRCSSVHGRRRSSPEGGAAH